MLIVGKTLNCKKRKGIHLLRSILTAIFLFLLWYLMSGIDKTLTLGLGVGSSIFAVWIVRRMENASEYDSLKVHLHPIELFKYCIWFLLEIFKSNWTVTKVILSPKMGINQNMFKVPFSQKSDLGQTIFANSITLTPGTISVEVEEDHFLVHALTFLPTDHEALAEMNNRISKIEGNVTS